MNETPYRVVLRRGREKAARNRHPWVFSGAIDVVEGEGPDGALADLYDCEGEFLARGFFNRRSQIAFRALSLGKEPIDLPFFTRRLESALALRRDLTDPMSDACRLAHAEGDGLPGLVIDRYGPFLVCQFLAAGMELLREPILDALESVLKPTGIWERSEGPGRKEEGLEPRRGLARGAEPPERVTIREGRTAYAVDVRHGNKTGFYLDQRPQRLMVAELAAGRAVLDVFSYTGGFALAAVMGGAAAVTAIDASAENLARIGEHLALNGHPDAAIVRRTGDAFKLLRSETGRYDLIVVDPPPFAKRKGEVEGACRGYKDLNLHAMRLLRPGGYLLTASCSHHIDANLLQQVLFGAAKDAGRNMQVVARTGHPPDHPVSILHPEGEYLKGFLLRDAG